MGNVGYTLEQRKQVFQQSVKNVADALSGSKYAPYIEFDCGGLTFATHRNTDYFMQMSITYTGAGEANKFNLSIAYTPKPGQDPNFIDKALAGVVNDTIPCHIRFGYSGAIAYELLSPKYECLVLGYNIQLRDNMIYYNLEVISSCMKYRELRFDFPLSYWRKGEVDENGNYAPANPIKVIKQTFTVCLKDEGQVVSDYHILYDDIVESMVEDMPLAPMEHASVFEYVDTILSQIKDKESDEAIYWYSVCDIEGHKSITIHRTINGYEDYTSKYLKNLEQQKDSQSLFTFDWGGNPRDKSKNTLIQAFETEYKGVVNLAMDSEIFKQRVAINSKGKAVSVTSPNDVDVGDYAEMDARTSARWWTEMTNYAYGASLEIQGIPADIPIGVLITVRPLIYGQEHHTTGVYMIIGATTNITSGSFTTNLKLVKFIDTEYNRLLKARERVKYWDEKRAEEYARMYTEESRPQNDTSNAGVSSRVATNQSEDTSKTTNFIPDPEYQNKMAQNMSSRENLEASGGKSKQ